MTEKHGLNITEELNKTITVGGKEVTMGEIVDMSEEKRKEVLVNLEKDASSSDVKSIFEEERKYVEKCKKTLSVLLNKID